MTYWSRAEGLWIERTIDVPDEELELLGQPTRQRVRSHLGLDRLDPARRPGPAFR